MDSMTSSEPPSPSQLERLLLLNGVVLETMRVYVSGTSTPRAHIFDQSLTRHDTVGINTRTALTDTLLPTGGGPTGTSPITIPAGKAIGTE
jgi:hypothetical protein